MNSAQRRHFRPRRHHRREPAKRDVRPRGFKHRHRHLRHGHAVARPNPGFIGGISGQIQFSNGRQHGRYCCANNTLIAHNTISGRELSAIAGFPAFANNFLNLFAPTNVVILDNILSDCGYSEPGIANARPTAEPAFALVWDVTKRPSIPIMSPTTRKFPACVILYNAVLNLRRALPLCLHNATDVNIIGNYFGPPVTNDGLVP